MDKNKQISLKNKKGILIRDVVTGEMLFRLTDCPDGEWIDCKINHGDMFIKIIDEDAFLYKKGDEWVIDYSKETLEGE